MCVLQYCKSNKTKFGGMIKTFIGTCSTENYQWRQFNTAEHRVLFEYNVTMFSFTNHDMNKFMNVYN